MARRRRKGKAGKWLGGLLTLLLSAPALYMLGALGGSIVPVNRAWNEPRQGTIIYLAANGIHTDIIMPVTADGLDWEPLLPRSDFAAPDPDARWIAFGAGEQRVYLNTPTWWDLTPQTVWSAMTGGHEVIHAEYVTDPAYAAREIRLRPEEYRRLWAAVRAAFQLGPGGRPLRIDHLGYGPADAFYRANGRASMFHTCNSWVASRLRLAGVKTSLWSPFTEGLLWRYRRVRERSG